MRVVAGCLSVFVLCASVLAYVGVYFASNLTANIVANGLNMSTDETFSPKPGEPINILVMGSDTRQGANSKGYGDPTLIAGARSDTAIVLHISGDRKHAMAVSIPRDSIVELPTCQSETGATVGGTKDRFNAAFEIGGPGCSVKTVESLTGLSINHFMVVDFAGFKNVVDALDGVEVCLNKPVDDAKSGLKLPAGTSVVRGKQALAFVRARETLGDGSDIGRIQRQQEFLSSAIRKATSTGTLADPQKLYAVLNAGTKSLQVDPALANFDALKDLALDSSGVKPSEITFVTVPWVENPDHATVSWSPTQADALWQAMKNDTQWPPTATVGADGKPLTAAPNKITVSIVDGSGSGQGQQLGYQLSSEGYSVADVSTSSRSIKESLVEYDPTVPEQVEAARTLSYATGLPIRAVAGLTQVEIKLSPGASAIKLKAVTTAKPVDPLDTAKPRTAAQSICSN